MKIYKIASLTGIWYHGSSRDFDKFNDYSWFTVDMEQNRLTCCIFNGGDVTITDKQKV